MTPARQAATTPPPQQKEAELKFTSRSELVLVPVVVADHSGKHIPNLKKEDFSILEDKKSQKIAIFEEVNTNPEKIQRQKLPANTVTNFSGMKPLDQTSRRLVIIALDCINTPFMDQVYARQQMIKFLAENVDSGALISLVSITRGGVKVIHDFTADPNVLIAALKKVKGSYSVAEGISAGAMDASIPDDITSNSGSSADTQALQAEVDTINDFIQRAEESFQAGEQRMRILATLDALQQVAQAYAGVPGRKALIWATAGFPFNLSKMSIVTGEFARDDISMVKDDYDRTWRILNNATISLYPVDVRGLVNSAYISPGTAVRERGGSNGTTRGRGGLAAQLNTQLSEQYWAHQDTLSTMQSFADMTGGRAFYNSNDLKGSFKSATNDSAAYYMLGYYLDKTNTKTGWRKLDVKVGPPHGDVRARTSVLVTAASLDPTADRQSDIAMAVNSPMDFTGIPIVVRWAPLPKDEVKNAKTAADGKKMIAVVIHVPPQGFTIDEANNNHMNLEFVGVLRKETGENLDSFGKVVEGNPQGDRLKSIKKGGMQYISGFELAPGEYSCRIVVRDNVSGRIGSALAQFKID